MQSQWQGAATPDEFQIDQWGAEAFHSRHITKGRRCLAAHQLTVPPLHARHGQIATRPAMHLVGLLLAAAAAGQALALQSSSRGSSSASGSSSVGGASSTGSSSDATYQQMLSEINSIRSRSNLEPLCALSQLNSAAGERSEAQAGEGKAQHSSTSLDNMGVPRSSIKESIHESSSSDIPTVVDEMALSQSDHDSFVGDYTHFGGAIAQSSNGKFYISMLFVKAPSMPGLDNCKVSSNISPILKRMMIAKAISGNQQQGKGSRQTGRGRNNNSRSQGRSTNNNTGANSSNRGSSRGGNSGGNNGGRTSGNSTIGQGRLGGNSQSFNQNSNTIQ